MNIWTPLDSDFLKTLDDSGIKLGGELPSRYKIGANEVGLIVSDDAANGWRPVLYTIDAEETSGFEQVHHDTFLRVVYDVIGRKEDSKEKSSKESLVEKFEEAGRAAAERISVASFSDSLTIGEININYSQDADTWSQGSQDLKISFLPTEDGGYYVIETERWAFDNKEDLLRILDDFISRSK